jgi:predicted TIM-barrel fold metal-dependent hydrolase
MRAPHRVDLHHHIIPDIYIEKLGDRIGIQGLLGPKPSWSPEISIEIMDRYGIAVAVTSISAPGFWFGDIQETRRLVRACNEYSAAMRQKYPDRFRILAALPLPGVEAVLDEIEYAFDTLSADGVVLLTHCGGRYPGDPEFDPVFAELDRRKATVFFHPTFAPYGQFPENIPAPTLEFPFETTRAIVSMLYAGTLNRYHNIQFIFAHAGGALPYLVERVARLAIRPELRANVPDGVLAELRRLNFDFALSANRFAIGPLLQLVPTTNLFFGSDFPHAGEQTLDATIRGLSELGLDSADLKRIETDNALRLFAQHHKNSV